MHKSFDSCVSSVKFILCLLKYESNQPQGTLITETSFVNLHTSVVLPLLLRFFHLQCNPQLEDTTFNCCKNINNMGSFSSKLNQHDFIYFMVSDIMLYIPYVYNHYSLRIENNGEP